MIAEPKLYAARVRACNVPSAMPAGTLRQVYVDVVNDGNWTWLSHLPPGPSVDLAVRVDGALITTIPLPEGRLEPGASTTFSFKWRAPIAGETCRFEFDMVEQNVTFFSSHQPSMFAVDIALGEPERCESDRWFDVATERNYWFYLPTEGIRWSAHGGSYPLFVRDAVGARFRDLEGHDYCDYVMGWGSCLLGYAHPHVQAALARSLATSALATLPYKQELELSEALAEFFPCAEMTAFGKNGSDVTTVAVRLARTLTGRNHVLFSGYHGWHDWNTNANGIARTSSSFPYGDLRALDLLLDEYDGAVGAIFVEAALQIEGVEGPVREADVAFLQGLRERCDRLGIVLIFDEIWTGFRYHGGSVQRHTGVVPDLACVGKALSNGMPLAAVVGKRDIFKAAVHRIHYTPTFKGEVYAFEAALAALDVYRSEDVPGAVWSYGVRLMDGISGLARELGVPMRATGAAPRMVIAFDLPDERTRVNARTLLTQEVLRGGLLSFRGFLIPSLAHGGAELERTLSIFGNAIEVVASALRRDAFVEVLEIPPIV